VPKALGEQALGAEKRKIEEGPRKKRIFLAEGIPSLNKGEVTILRGLQKTIAAHIGEHEFTVFSWAPDVDRQRYEPEVRVVGKTVRLADSPWSAAAWELHVLVHFVQLLIWGAICRMLGDRAVALFKEGLWSAYAEADLILFGHDNMLGGPRISPWHVGTVLFARLTGKPVAVCAGTVGPFRSDTSLRVAKYLFDRVDLITLRDPFSADYCERTGLANDRTYLTADVAFLLEPVSKGESERILMNEGIPRDRPIVGFTVVKGWRILGHAFLTTDPDMESGLMEERHTEVIARVVDYLIEHLHVSVVFIPHCIGPGSKDDRLVARQVYEKVRRKDRTWLIAEEYSASELKRLIGQFDLFIGERTHSVINALSMGVPSIAISYPDDHRTYGIVGGMLGQEKLLYDVRALEVISLCSAIEACWERREQIRRELQERIPKIEERAQLNGALLARLLEGERERGRRA